MKARQLQWQESDGYHRARWSSGPMWFEVVVNKSWRDDSIWLSWYLRGFALSELSRKVDSVEHGKEVAQRQFNEWVMGLLEDEPCNTI